MAGVPHPLRPLQPPQQEDQSPYYRLCVRNPCRQQNYRAFRLHAIQRKKGAAPPPFRTPRKGTSPLDPVKMPCILYLIQSKRAISSHRGTYSPTFPGDGGGGDRDIHLPCPDACGPLRCCMGRWRIYAASTLRSSCEKPAASATVAAVVL